MKTLTINRFFTSVLGAQLRNPRWSWGAQDPETNRLFLRVWDDQIEHFDESEWLRIGYGQSARRSNGRPERQAHIDLLRSGAEGYGVVCVAKEKVENETRKIVSFNQSRLAKLGELRVLGELTYAKVEQYVDLADLEQPPSAQTELEVDLRALARARLDSTTRQMLVNSRLGQGQFRADVLKCWGNRCAVTGARSLKAIRASHIRPWRHSNNQERLDPNNGLALVATLDALFDVYLISFAADGQMLVSPAIHAQDMELLGLKNAMLRTPPCAQLEAYMQSHRAEFHSRSAKVLRHST